jgi:peptidoglycan biosynthesis protein MviN/MurJ (putative lipid II flippase)
MFGLLPLCVGGLLVSHPLVTALFGRGAFTVVNETADIFGVLLIGMVLNLYIVLFTRLLVYLRHTFTQMVMAFATSILNAVLNIVFIGWFGLVGIAFSTVVTRFIVLAATGVILARFLPEVQLGRVVPRFIATATCTLTMGIVVIVVRGIVWQPGLEFLNQLLALSVVVGTGGVTYIFTARLIKHPDLQMLVDVASQTRYGYVVKVLRL